MQIMQKADYRWLYGILINKPISNNKNMLRWQHFCYTLYVFDKSGLSTCVPQLGHNVSDNKILTSHAKLIS